jgi:hypothetical protein
MSCYQIDYEAVELERRLAGNDAITAPIVEALLDLMGARRQAGLALSEWMGGLRAATERALRRVDHHVRAGLLAAYPFGGMEQEGALGYGIECEHELLRCTLTDQLSAASIGPGEPLAGKAARLLHMTIDSECLLAVHLNGLGRILRQSSMVLGKELSA